MLARMAMLLSTLPRAQSTEFPELINHIGCNIIIVYDRAKIYAPKLAPIHTSVAHMKANTASD
jgi:hypothetical protein